MISSGFAQQWSAEQKEVWEGVQKYWEIDNSNPVEFLKYFDDSYLGWSYDNEAPGTKDDKQSIATIIHAVESGINWIDTATIVGARRKNQTDGIIGALDFRLSDDELAEIEANLPESINLFELGL